MGRAARFPGAGLLQRVATAQLPSSPAATQPPPGAIAPPPFRPLFALQSHDTKILQFASVPNNDAELGGPDEQAVRSRRNLSAALGPTRGF